MRTPPFACELLHKGGSELVYRCAKQHSEPGSLTHNKRGAKADEITLTPLELIDRIAALVPPPHPDHAAGTVQTPGALPVGSAHHTHLRGVSAAVPPLWRADANESSPAAPGIEVDQRMSW